MGDPVTRRLGKDVAFIIYRYVHRYHISDMNREYTKGIHHSKMSDGIALHGELFVQPIEGRQLAFHFCYRGMNNIFRDAPINNPKVGQTLYALPRHYWEVKELY